MIFHVHGVKIGEVCQRVVSKAIAAKLLGIGVEYHLVRACRHEESVVRVAARRREVEDEDEVAAHVAQHLVAIVVPYLSDGRVLEVLL